VVRPVGIVETFKQEGAGFWWNWWCQSPPLGECERDEEGQGYAPTSCLLTHVKIRQMEFLNFAITTKVRKLK